MVQAIESRVSSPHLRKLKDPLMKNILGVQSAPQSHWVGDGFPVRSLFSYHEQGQEMSPFLLLDYAGPAEFKPAARPRGVGVHPHRGFETVTIVYQGEVEHRDSTGAAGRIGPGDVQWMTAAAGILHEEFHSREFTQKGGMLEMVQLWVNLPAKDKLSAPGYQDILDGDIPAVELPDAAGTLRVIAGEFKGRPGPARTFTPIEVWDVQLNKDATAKFTLPEGHTAAVVVLRGAVAVSGSADGLAVAREAQMVLLDQKGSDFSIAAKGEARVLILGGAPIDEPIAGYGPFVMNTREEIQQAITDFNSGKFGSLDTVSSEATS
jgi:redox-sensitive bicupin YhaK (pirin superfamily)